MGKRLFFHLFVCLVFYTSAYTQSTERKVDDTASVGQQKKPVARDTVLSGEDTTKITTPTKSGQVDTTVEKKEKEPTAEDTTVSVADTTQVAVPPEPLVDTTIMVPLLDFKNADIRDVFNDLAKACSLNISLDQSVQGNVTISFNKVVLNEVLNFLLMHRHYEILAAVSFGKFYSRRIKKIAQASRCTSKKEV